MPTNVEKSPIRLSNNVSRNVFDLSRRNCFTQKLGELLPVFMTEAIPGDKFKINLDSFTRTTPLNAPLFSRIREYYDVFFVPYRLLWRDFPSMVTNQAYAAKQATAITSAREVSQATPYISAADLYDYIPRPKVVPYNAFANGSNPVYDIMGTDRSAGTYKLLQYCGYYGMPRFKGGSADRMLSPFPLLAYHKIYNDFYRNTMWERESPESYNIDYMTDSEPLPIREFFHTESGKSRWIDTTFQTMLDIRYADLLKDVFMGVLPNSQYGAKSTVGIGDSNSLLGNFKLSATGNAGGHLRLSNDGPDPTQKYVGIGAAEPGPKPSNFNLYANSINQASLNFDVLTLRAAQAKQKYLEITLSNKSDYASQVKAHFGVKVSSLLASMCDYLGGNGVNVSFDNTTNTNFAEGSKPSIQSNGTFSNKKSFDFEAKEHGIIVVMHHYNVYPEYATIGMDWLNAKTMYTDWAIPEFDKLGYEAIPMQYLNMVSAPDTLSTKYFGYNVRYYDYKSNYDIVLGDLSANNNVANDDFFKTCGTRSNYTIQINDSNFGGLVANSWSPSYTTFKCSPMLLDHVVFDKATSSWSTDPFISCLDVNCTVVRNLDRKGMPY